MAEPSSDPPRSPAPATPERPVHSPVRTWRSFFSRAVHEESHESDTGRDEDATTQPKWSMGVLNDPKTIQVPGSVLLLAKDHNTPLGLQNAPARTSHSSLPTGMPVDAAPRRSEDDKKKTSDGKIILEPQPEDSGNDPLNWPSWRRDLALLSLGFYCMLGGSVTSLLAAGFTNIAEDYHVQVEEVALTTGFAMMGLGLGSVIASPTAILFGKRPVYLASAILFIASSAWCAVSPSFPSLLAARTMQGMSISPVECLPSATIAEIFFLHERAFRVGIYTLLLLGGKNLIPLVSAAIIGGLSWRWVFWVLCMAAAFAWCLLFLFVPETFWDRTPVPKSKMPNRPGFMRRLSSTMSARNQQYHPIAPATPRTPNMSHEENTTSGIQQKHEDVHVGFAEPKPDAAHSNGGSNAQQLEGEKNLYKDEGYHIRFAPDVAVDDLDDKKGKDQEDSAGETTMSTAVRTAPAVKIEAPSDDDEKSSESSQKDALEEPFAAEATGRDQVDSPPVYTTAHLTRPGYTSRTHSEVSHAQSRDPEKGQLGKPPHRKSIYTHELRHSPNKSWSQQLKPFNGRLNHDNWLKVLVRPFILFSYPAVLWSAAVYASSVGWLIVIAETIAMIYRNKDTYNFTALQTGLVYISPFLGGVMGTGVAGKVSDIVVKFMARRNGGLYEPEFRLVMALPVAIATVIGLMGFGWSAQEKDLWIVPTIFFGILSFGCCMGSTTAITFSVDSYRQYAGEALVTLNFSKNVLHGLVFSLFASRWVQAEGSKMVFIYIGIIQLLLLLSTIPLFIFGKRCRMWTVRRNLMEKF